MSVLVSDKRKIEQLSKLEPVLNNQKVKEDLPVKVKLINDNIFSLDSQNRTKNYWKTINHQENDEKEQYNGQHTEGMKSFDNSEQNV